MLDWLWISKTPIVAPFLPQLHPWTHKTCKFDEIWLYADEIHLFKYFFKFKLDIV